MLSVTTKDDITGTEVNNLLWYTVGVSGSSGATGSYTKIQGLEPTPAQTGPLSFQWAPSKLYDQTDNAVQIQATDVFGNQMKTNTLSVVVANTLPSLTINTILPDPDAAVAGVYPANGIVQAGQVLYLRGTVQFACTLANGACVLHGTDTAQFSLYIDGVPQTVAVYASATSPTGTCNWNTTNNLGMHTVYFQGTDVFGRTITSNSVQVDVQDPRQILTP